ncbi:MAG: ATP-binding cassette domain-containing protein [Cytophagales bacterium]
MMNIVANNLGKRFDRGEWIFKDFSFNFLAGNCYALIGPNGSGKSTLLQILWGQMLPSKGMVGYQIEDITISPVDVFKHLSIATPYMDLIEEFSLEEMVNFHFHHKIPHNQITIQEAMELMELRHARHKKIRDFSSGMRQRLKLALAFFSTSDALFLDEPTTNLDQNAFQWYWKHLKSRPIGQLVLIASNQTDEYPETAEKIDILQYKTGTKQR